MGFVRTEPLQRINGAKNVLVTIVNATAAAVFVIFAHVAWLAVLLVAIGSTAGGLIGARAGRRLPPRPLRIIIVVIGVLAATKLIFFRLGGASPWTRGAGEPGVPPRRGAGAAECPNRPSVA